MTKPLPIIHLANPADHLRLVRALHALGWAYSYEESPDESAAAYARDVFNKKTGAVIYPWLGLDSDGVTAYIHQGHAGRVTVVNSVAHFLDYTRRLPRPQVADYEDDGFDDFAPVLDPDGN